MDEQQRASLLRELAVEADREREAFLVEAGRRFARFFEANRERLAALGGLVLIDDGPDYLAVSETGTFQSRSRVQDDDGTWLTESEEFEDPAQLVEVFNPADLYGAFSDAAQDEAELGEDEELDGTPPEDGSGLEADEAPFEADEAAQEGGDTRDSFEDDWLVPVAAPRTVDEAARLLYDLALTFQERSQLREAQLLDDFQVASENLAAMLGDSKILEDEDERLWYRASGAFEGEVVPDADEDGEPTWQALTSPDDLVQYYDPTDLFGDLAEAIAIGYPDVAPELVDDGGRDPGNDAA
jgi:hypothetical protein